MFPSPIGVLYISIDFLQYAVELDEKVSVPYWGSLYFNKNRRNKDMRTFEFPSPIGVLYISISYTEYQRISF